MLSRHTAFSFLHSLLVRKAVWFYIKIYPWESSFQVLCLLILWNGHICAQIELAMGQYLTPENTGQMSCHTYSRLTDREILQIFLFGWFWYRVLNSTGRLWPYYGTRIGITGLCHYTQLGILPILRQGEFLYPYRRATLSWISQNTSSESGESILSGDYSIVNSIQRVWCWDSVKTGKDFSGERTLGVCE